MNTVQALEWGIYMAVQSKVKYRRLMEKAKELFIQFGYKAVSMDQIAEAAGISKATIYNYFPSKEELFVKVMRDIADEAYRDLDNHLNNTDGAIAKIDVLINFSMEKLNQFSLAFYRDIMTNPYITSKIMAIKKQKAREIFENIIKTGIKNGEIRDVDVEFLVTLLNIMIDGILNNFSDIINDKEQIKDFCEKFYDFLKYGLSNR